MQGNGGIGTWNACPLKVGLGKKTGKIPYNKFTREDAVRVLPPML